MLKSWDKLVREARFAGRVYLMTGVTSAVPAVLARTEEELVLVAGGEKRFRTLLSEVEKVEFPWWSLGGVMRVWVAGTRYWLSFSPPATIEGEGTDFSRNLGGGSDGTELLFRQATSARQSSKEWKAALSDIARG